MTEQVHTFDLENDYHPLFTPTPTSKPDYRPELFHRIRVFRLTAAGPKQIPVEYLPEQLPNAEVFCQLLGGGTFELWAIKLPSQQVYTRRTVTFDAPAKAPPSAAVMTAGAAVDSTTPTNPMLPPGVPPEMAFYWMQQQAERAEEKARLREEREREERRREREETARREDRASMLSLAGTVLGAVIPLLAGHKDSASDLIKAHAELMKAAQPPTAQKDAATVMRETLELGEMIDKRAEKMRPAAPEESVSETVSTILGAAVPMIQMLQAAKPAAAALAGATPAIDVAGNAASILGGA